MDEAYQPFASKTWLTRIREAPERHGHVLLMRTLSKFGLAGVRLGYMMGPKALLADIDKVRPPYNISVLNTECALFALEHTEVFAAQAETIRSQRQWITEQLSGVTGFTVFPSEANMLLLRVPDAQQCFDALKRAGVLVKNVSKMHPLLHNCLRLTVGTPNENAQMVAALQTTS